MLKAAAVSARKAKHYFLRTRALRMLGLYHEKAGRRRKAAEQFNSAAHAAEDGGLLGELRVVLADLARVLASIPANDAAADAVRIATDGLELSRSGPPNDRNIAELLRARIAGTSHLKEWQAVLRDSRELVQVATRLADPAHALRAYLGCHAAYTALAKPDEAEKCAVLAYWLAENGGTGVMATYARYVAERLFPGATGEQILAKARRSEKRLREGKFPAP